MQLLISAKKVFSDGFETDTNNLIYCGNIEDNSISIFDPNTALKTVFVRDTRFSWTSRMAVATDGYFYFIENQLWLNAGYWGGVDRRLKPCVLFKVKLPGNGTKITQPAP